MRKHNTWFSVPLVTAVTAILSFGGAEAAFACGPDLATYEVRAANGSPAPGVRCVRFVNRQSFAWYGEGRWGSSTYRHLGYAVGPAEVITGPGNSFTGYAADFHGNGETTSGNFPGTLDMRIPNPPAQPAWNETNPPREIRVGGAWREVWVLRAGSVSGWSSLPPVQRCGPHLEAYAVSVGTNDDRVRQVVPGSSSWGVRCLLNADGKQPAAWYGEGAWGGNDYRHLGTAFFGLLGASWGAADICQPSFRVPARATFCGAARFGDLQLRRANADRSVRVTGAWNEWWDR